MELDLLDVHFDLKATKPKEIEEALEDPFAVRLLPDNDRDDGEARFYALGRTVSDRYLFLCFWSDGKKIRIIAARDMTDGEEKFYNRKYASFK
ncbi:MAG: BrnT family toxin [Akkermansiaceae bacterium]|nr:BrnT family toxin [Akkermansiaceae bacterium]NNM29100.1 BrnT family toxin [Akkermansiaceae bacterium]